MSEAKFWKSGYEVPCQIYTCNRPSAWMIGANADTLGLNLFLCQECVDSLFQSMLESEVGKRVLERLAAATPVPPPSSAGERPGGLPGPEPEFVGSPPKGKPVQPLRIPAPKDLALMCPVCDKGPFKNKTGLTSHIRQVHKHAE